MIADLKLYLTSTAAACCTAAGSSMGLECQPFRSLLEKQQAALQAALVVRVRDGERGCEQIGWDLFNQNWR